MRLIDADKLIEDLEKVKKESESLVDISHIIGFQSVIDAQPTAFDVDRVISNIWDRSELIHIKHTHNDEIEDYIRTTDASEIVKASGIDESI